MVGMLEQAAAAPEPTGSPEEQAAAAPEPTGSPEGGENVTPEEQAVYDKVVDTAYSLIYDEKAMPKMMATFKNKQKPVNAVAQNVSAVMSRVQDVMTKAGTPVPSDTMLPAIEEVVSDFADLLAESQVVDLQQEQLDAAYTRTVAMYQQMEAKAGRSDAEGGAQTIQYINRAAEAGAMNEVLPGLEGA
jgi:hypothetical protein